MIKTAIEKGIWFSEIRVEGVCTGRHQKLFLTSDELDWYPDERKISRGELEKRSAERGDSNFQAGALFMPEHHSIGRLIRALYAYF